MRTLPRPHTLLKATWNTPVLKARLRRFFGCSMSHLYALLSGERPCLIDRYCDLVDEAMVIDPTGKKARRLAEYPRRYLRALVHEQAAGEAEWNNHAAADHLLEEACQAIKKLNSLDLNSMDPAALEEAREELLDVQQVTRNQLARIDARMRALGDGRQVSRVPAARFPARKQGG